MDRPPPTPSDPWTRLRSIVENWQMGSIALVEIAQAAESWLEDDTNEDGLPENEHAEFMFTSWEILDVLYEIASEPIDPEESVNDN